MRDAIIAIVVICALFVIGVLVWANHQSTNELITTVQQARNACWGR